MSQHGAYWIGRAPADDNDIAKLTAVIPFALPVSYLDLLRRHNGGEGPLALAPLWLRLWDIDNVIEFSRLKLPAWRFPNHFFFADNGAVENIAMRRTASGALEIVTIDITAGPDSAEVIAPDFETFANAIGK